MITLGSAEETHAFCAERAPALRCLADAGAGEGYRAFGLQHANAGQLFGPAVWLQGARVATGGSFKGAPLGKPVGDPFMLPGVFRIDSAGKILFAYYSKHAGDYPSERELVGKGSVK